MQNFVFRDSNFDLKNCQQYCLSIQADLDGFSFVIRQNQTGQIAIIHTHSFKLSHYGILARKIQELTEEYELLKGNFDKIQVYLPGYHPGVFSDDLHYEKEIRNSLLEKKSLKNLSRTVSSVPIISGYQFCWLIDLTLKETILEYYPNAIIRHYALPLFHYFKRMHNDAFKEWFCYLSEEEICFFGFNQGQFSFFNEFSSIDEQDVLYFLMAIIRLPGMENAGLTIIGQEEKKEMISKSCLDNGIMVVSHHPEIRIPQMVHDSPPIVNDLIPLLI